MNILVLHRAFGDNYAAAKVAVPSELSPIDAFEYAYRWTNNIEGSWSRTDIENNGDFNKNVEVLEPLDGTMGHRSTSTGDLMQVIDDERAPEALAGQTYEVASFGFNHAHTGEPLTNPTDLSKVIF